MLFNIAMNELIIYWHQV